MKDKRLGGDTMAPSGLYARLCHAFLVLYVCTREPKKQGQLFSVTSPNANRFAIFFYW